MPFEKNVSGNQKGKPKGAVNKTTRELREIINEFLSKNLDKIQDDFDKLEPKEKLLFIDKMLKHVLPPKVEEVEGVDIIPDEVVITIIDGKRVAQIETSTFKKLVCKSCKKQALGIANCIVKYNILKIQIHQPYKNRTNREN